MRRDRDWDQERWLTFAAALRKLRDRTLEAVGTFPTTRGSGKGFVPTMNRLLDASETLMFAVEDAYVEQAARHGSWLHVEDALRFLEEGPQLEDLIRSRPVCPVIPPEDWIEIGRRWNWLRGAAGGLLLSLNETIPSTHRAIRCFNRLCEEIGAARVLLSRLLRSQYPEWKSAGAVFYGNSDLRTDDVGTPCRCLRIPFGCATAIRRAERAALGRRTS